MTTLPSFRIKILFDVMKFKPQIVFEPKICFDLLTTTILWIQSGGNTELQQVTFG